MNEIRDTAWRLLWQSKWLSRFVFLIVAFGFIRYIAVNFSASLLLDSSSQGLSERLASAETAQELLTLLRDPSVMRSLLLMAAMSLFVAMTINSIAAYGLARVRLDVAAGNEPPSWIRMCFGGFKDPFGMLALGIMHALFVWWPVFFIVVPAFVLIVREAVMTETYSPYYLIALPFSLISIIPFYRYRQAWFIKAAHPDFSALECLRQSAELMAGQKMRNFRLDCSFWRPIALFLSIVFIATMTAVVGAPPILAFLAALLISALSLYLSAYMPLAQAIFHLQLRKIKETAK